eukprot:gene1074-407_t
MNAVERVEIEQRELRAREREQALEAREQRVYRLEEEVTRLNVQLAAVQEREDDSQVENTRTIRQLEGRLTLKDEALQTKERQVMSLRGQVDEVRKQWEEETAKNAQDYEHLLSTLRSSDEQSVMKCAALEEELVSARRQLENRKKEGHWQQMEFLEQSEMLRAKAARVEPLEQDMASLQSQLKEAHSANDHTERDTLRLKVADLEQELLRFEQNDAAAKQEMATLSARQRGTEGEATKAHQELQGLQQECSVSRQRVADLDMQLADARAQIARLQASPE